MNIKDNFLIYKIFNTICTNNNIENLDEDLKLVFSDYYDISEINILYFDKQINKLKIVVKDFELADTIRKELLDMGIELTDTREGTTYKVIK